MESHGSDPNEYNSPIDIVKFLEKMNSTYSKYPTLNGKIPDNEVFDVVNLITQMKSQGINVTNLVNQLKNNGVELPNNIMEYVNLVKLIETKSRNTKSRDTNRNTKSRDTNRNTKPRNTKKCYSCSHNSVYVKAAASPGGDGSKCNPYNTLEEAEANSVDGDTIYVLPSPANFVLDGQIVLKPGQKIIGKGPRVTQVPQNAAGARITNTTGVIGNSRAVVRLAEDGNNEICNIHFVNPISTSIVGNTDGDPSSFGYGDVKVNQCLFTGGLLNSGGGFIQFSTFISSSTGVTNVEFTNNVVKDGETLAGLQLRCSGNFIGTANTKNNIMNNIGYRSFSFSSFENSSIDVTMLNDTVDNIGARGPDSIFANADSILVQLANAGKINIFVDGYDYRNTSQVGGIGNTAIEFFIIGPAAGPPAQWSDGAEITAKIVNSSIRDSVTESIQLWDFGTNCLIDVEIDNTQILDAKPRGIIDITGGLLQGGAISILTSVLQGGNTVNLKVENSDIIGSTKYAVSALDGLTGVFGTTVLDMGNGSLGSVGNNIIIGNALGDIELLFVNGVGQNNYWGGSREASVSTLTGSTFDDSNPLTSIPQRFYKKCHKRCDKKCHKSCDKRKCNKKRHKRRCNKRY